jgi:hypothetical protein
MKILLTLAALLLFGFGYAQAQTNVPLGNISLPNDEYVNTGKWQCGQKTKAPDSETNVKPDCTGAEAIAWLQASWRVRILAAFDGPTGWIASWRKATGASDDVGLSRKFWGASCADRKTAVDAMAFLTTDEKAKWVCP